MNMSKLPVKTIQEYIELLKDVKWLRENIIRMIYPKEANMNDLEKLENRIIKELFELIGESS